MTDAKSANTLVVCVDSDETPTTDSLRGDAQTIISFLSSAITIALFIKLTCAVLASEPVRIVPEPLSVLVEPTIKNDALNNSPSLKCFSQAATFSATVGLLPSAPAVSDVFSGNAGLVNDELTACANVLVSVAEL